MSYDIPADKIVGNRRKIKGRRVGDEMTITLKFRVREDDPITTDEELPEEEEEFPRQNAVKQLPNKQFIHKQFHLFQNGVNCVEE